MGRALGSLLRAVVLLPSLLLVGLIRLIKWSIAPPALLLQLLFGVPLALARTRLPLRPRFVPVRESDLSAAAWIEFANAAEALAAEGFVHQGDFRCDHPPWRGTLWLRLLSQPDQGVRALVAHGASTDGVRPARHFIEFITEFQDGRALNLNNRNAPYPLPAPDYLARLQLKDVWDPRALHALHRKLVTALNQPVDVKKIEPAARDPARLLAEDYGRELQALIARGWLRPAMTDSARLSLWGALTSVWRQAWPLAVFYLRAADRRARKLLVEHGIHAAAFTGAAPGIVVARHPLPEPARFATVRAGYELALPLARRTDPSAVLEGVVVELDRDDEGAVVLLEFHYSFRGCDDHAPRRIRRLRGFDILLAPEVGTLALTAMEREFECASDEAAWAELTASSPLVPLALGPWLRDLDQILPTALAALDARTGTGGVVPDSASLYHNEDGILCWQVVAWNGDDHPPLHVRLDARSGRILAAS